MIEYKSVSLANQVYERIEYNILSGYYKNGEVISESRLSKELGVSRTPIREAISRLLQERLVDDSPIGTVVIGIRDKDIDDYYTVKRLLEIPTAGYAAKHITQEELAELEEIVDQQEFYASKTEIDIEKIRELDSAFHSAIYRSSDSRLLEHILQPLHHNLLRYRSASLQNDGNKRVSESIREHRAILNALREHDEEKAQIMMLNHVEHAHKSVVKNRK